MWLKMTKKEIKFRPVTFVIFLPEGVKYDVFGLINYDYLEKIMKEALKND